MAVVFLSLETITEKRFGWENTGIIFSHIIVKGILRNFLPPRTARILGEQGLLFGEITLTRQPPSINISPVQTPSVVMLSSTRVDCQSGDGAHIILEALLVPKLPIAF